MTSSLLRRAKKMATIETRNRKLEQTLFNLGVHHLSWKKDIDGYTVWVYPNNDSTCCMRGISSGL